MRVWSFLSRVPPWFLGCESDWQSTLWLKLLFCILSCLSSATAWGRSDYWPKIHSIANFISLPPVGASSKMQPWLQFSSRGFAIPNCPGGFNSQKPVALHLRLLIALMDQHVPSSFEWDTLSSILHSKLLTGGRSHGYKYGKVWTMPERCYPTGIYGNFICMFIWITLFWILKILSLDQLWC